MAISITVEFAFELGEHIQLVDSCSGRGYRIVERVARDTLATASGPPIVLLEYRCTPLGNILSERLPTFREGLIERVDDE